MQSTTSHTLRRRLDELRKWLVGWDEYLKELIKREKEFMDMLDKLKKMAKENEKTKGKTIAQFEERKIPEKVLPKGRTNSDCPPLDVHFSIFLTLVGGGPEEEGGIGAFTDWELQLKIKGSGAPPETELKVKAFLGKELIECAKGVIKSDDKGNFNGTIYGTQGGGAPALTFPVKWVSICYKKGEKECCDAFEPVW